VRYEFHELGVEAVELSSFILSRSRVPKFSIQASASFPRVSTVPTALLVSGCYVSWLPETEAYFQWNSPLTSFATASVPSLTLSSILPSRC